MGFIYRVRRSTPRHAVSVKPITTAGGPTVTVGVDASEPSYRDLQETAKSLGISAKQKASALKKAIKAKSNE